MTDQAERLRELVSRTGTRSRCRTLVITSGKGGVGKTNLTVNLALALARRDKRVVLFDADLGMANVDVLMGISPPHSIVDVIQGRKRLDEVIFAANDRLSVVPGGSGISELANLPPEDLEGMVARLSELESRADWLLVDTGAGISRNVLNFVLAAPEVIVVTTPEPTAVTDAYGIIKSIAAQSPETPIQLVINMVESEAEAKTVASKLIMIVNRFLSAKVSYLGFLEKDGNVGRAVLQQQPFSSAYPYSVATRRINLLADLLQTQGEEAAPPQGGFFSRLVKQIFR